MPPSSKPKWSQEKSRSSAEWRVRSAWKPPRIPAPTKLFFQFSSERICHLLPSLQDRPAVVRVKTSDFVMGEAMVNRDEFGQADGGGARQAGFGPAFHRNIGRFARRSVVRRATSKSISPLTSTKPGRRL